MAAPFTCDEQVTIEAQAAGADPAYGTETGAWVPVFARYWANVQDVLPKQGETTENSLRQGVQRTRLRLQGAGAATGKMRAVLHNRGDLVMQIIAGPALLDDRMHHEFMLESYSNG